MDKKTPGAVRASGVIVVQNFKKGTQIHVRHDFNIRNGIYVSGHCCHGEEAFQVLAPIPV